MYRYLLECYCLLGSSLTMSVALHERLELYRTYISVPDDVGYSLAIILRLATATPGCCGTGLP